MPAVCFVKKIPSRMWVVQRLMTSICASPPMCGVGGGGNPSVLESGASGWTGHFRRLTRVLSLGTWGCHRKSSPGVPLKYGGRCLGQGWAGDHSGRSWAEIELFCPPGPPYWVTGSLHIWPCVCVSCLFSHMLELATLRSWQEYPKPWPS